MLDLRRASEGASAPCALDDVADRHLFERHLVAERDERVGDEKHGAQRVHVDPASLSVLTITLRPLYVVIYRISRTKIKICAIFS